MKASGRQAAAIAERTRPSCQPLAVAPLRESSQCVLRRSASTGAQVIMEACRRGAAATAERTRLSRKLLAVAPLLMPDVLRLRTAPGDAAMKVCPVA